MGAGSECKDLSLDVPDDYASFRNDYIDAQRRSQSLDSVSIPHTSSGRHSVKRKAEETFDKESNSQSMNEAMNKKVKSRVLAEQMSMHSEKKKFKTRHSNCSKRKATIANVSNSSFARSKGEEGFPNKEVRIKGVGLIKPGKKFKHEKSKAKPHTNDPVSGVQERITGNILRPVNPFSFASSRRNIPDTKLVSMSEENKENCPHGKLSISLIGSNSKTSRKLERKSSLPVPLNLPLVQKKTPIDEEEPEPKEIPLTRFLSINNKKHGCVVYDLSEWKADEETKINYSMSLSEEKVNNVMKNRN